MFREYGPKTGIENYFKQIKAAFQLHYYSYMYDTETNIVQRMSNINLKYLNTVGQPFGVEVTRAQAAAGCTRPLMNYPTPHSNGITFLNYFCN